MQIPLSESEGVTIISHSHSHPFGNSSKPSNYTDNEKGGDVGAYQYWQQEQGLTIKFFVRFNGITREFDKNGIEVRK